MSRLENTPPDVLTILDALCDDTANQQDVDKLEELVGADGTAVGIVLDYLQMHSDLHFELTSRKASANVFHGIGLIHNTVDYSPQSVAFSYLVATVLVGIGLLIASFMPTPQSAQLARHSTASPSARMVVVGRITGMVDCQWAGSEGSLQFQSPVHLHDRFALSSGLMEITYDTGAKVILQGPCTYEADSTAGGFLSLGRLTARLENKAESGKRKADSPLSTLHPPLFAIRTPFATVTDLGTEFGVEVTNDRACRLTVFQGNVVLQTRQSSGVPPQTIALAQNEGACVQSSGVLNRYDSESSETSEMATEFVRELPRRDERTTSIASNRSNPINSMPGLLYHLDAAHGVTVDNRGCVRVWADQSKNGYNFVRAWTSNLVHVAGEPSFNNRPVVRNATTNIPGLRLWRDTAPRSIIIVASTADAGPAGGVWGHQFGGVRRANPDPDTGWVVDNATVDDFCYGGSFYVNGVAGNLQEYDSPGIMEAYSQNPNVPVFDQTALFGNSTIENGSRWWQGDIAEIIAFDRVLTQTERASIVGYLGAKYRIATPFDSSKAEASPSSSNMESPLPPTGKEKTP